MQVITEIIELIETMRHGGLRVRTALWLVSSTDLAQLPDRAARLGIDLVDARQPILDKVAPDQRFLGLGVRKIIDALDTLCLDNQTSDCLLVSNCDLLIAKLSSSERKELWEILYWGFPYRQRALLLVIPQSAITQLPGEQELDQWRKEGRLVP